MDNTRAQQAADITIFFKYARENLPKIPDEIARLEKEAPQDQQKIKHARDVLNLYKVATLIEDRNIDELKKMDAKQLKFQDGQIWVPGKLFKDQMDGRLASRILGGENALAFTLFYSIFDKSDEDADKTLTLLKVLLDKGLDPNGWAGEAYFVKNDPSDSFSSDYPAVYSLPEVAIIYSSPEALKLLIEHGAKIDTQNIEFLLGQMKQQGLPNIQEFEDAIVKNQGFWNSFVGSVKRFIIRIRNWF